MNQNCRLPFAAMIVAWGIHVFGLTAGFAENWPQWRGPTGLSISSETNLPLQFGENEGLAWKVDLPEWGTSTPAIWDDVLFLTTEHEGQLLVLCFETATGKVVWQRQVGEGIANRKQPDSVKRSSKFHNLHNLASPSPITDGERVIVHFGNGDLASYTFAGELEWQRNLTADFGPYTIWWGHANSPVFFGDLVISVCMQDSMQGDWEKLSPSYVVAHDKRTGKVVWKTMRMTGGDAEECDAYTTPVFRTTPSGIEMIVMGGNHLDAYDPTSGDRLWTLPGLVGGRTITGPTFTQDLVFATIGMRGPLHAVRIDRSSPQKPQPQVAWKLEQGTPDTPCPVIDHGMMFLVTDNGIAQCLDVQTGKELWKHRLGGNFKASPLSADGRIYFLNLKGECTVVVAAAAEYQELAKNQFNDEFLASPAVSRGRIYFRGRQKLYAVGK